MIISQIFIAFIIFSLAGWIWETIYCTIKSAAWQNRGFLYGPVCPIYGTGAIAAWFLFTATKAHAGDPSTLPAWAIFLICAAGSAFLEYGTSFVLEKLFGARWWDYSNAPLNANGRICLPATMAFGLVGVLIVRFVFPRLEMLNLSVLANVNPLVYEALALLLMAVFAADFVLTVANVTQLVSKLNRFEEEWTSTMEDRYAVVGEGQRLMAERVSAFSKELTARQKYIAKNIQRRGSAITHELLENLRERLGALPRMRAADKEKAQSDRGGDADA